MRKETNRPLRVAELIKRELALLIRTLDDPSTHQATITHVDVAPDLKSARVYFTSFAGEAGAEPMVAAFKRAAGYLRRELAKRVALRVIPDLRFHFDASIERGDRLARLIDMAIDNGSTDKNS